MPTSIYLFIYFLSFVLKEKRNLFYLLNQTKHQLSAGSFVSPREAKDCVRGGKKEKAVNLHHFFLFSIKTQRLPVFLYFEKIHLEM